jgi:hypothetical protein
MNDSMPRACGLHVRGEWDAVLSALAAMTGSKPEPLFDARISAYAGCGHAVAFARGRFVPRAAIRASKLVGLLVETQPTGNTVKRLTRHIQSIDRGLLVLIAAGHPAGDHFLGPEAQLLSNYRLKPHERDLRACGQAPDLCCKHQTLQEQATIKPIMFRQRSVGCKDQAHRRSFMGFVLRRGPHPTTLVNENGASQRSKIARLFPRWVLCHEYLSRHLGRWLVLQQGDSVH